MRKAPVRINIYIDDVRNLPDYHMEEVTAVHEEVGYYATQWVVCPHGKSVLDEIACMEPHERLGHISFDHDLGMVGHDGYDIAKAICALDKIAGICAADFTWEVHSANPVGKANIEAYLTNYFSDKRKAQNSND